ncbi:MAG: Stp1/IreP family PP2C-type Ser/Thr phosphatase [Acidimicrobiia bacterium]|nr:Stp1/IreP family PP2C-type Ser/Thr phosphatase [Acidimicrobiia bacterium]
MRYVWSSASHKGMVRDNNEDAAFPDTSGESTDSAVLIVADGMGGHVAGEVASRIAVNTAASSDLEPEDRVAAANRAIREEVAREPSLDGMGTTMTLLLLDDRGIAHLAHVGDSRAYLLRGEDMQQLTEDHTVAAEAVSTGQISEDDARNHPQRHMLTRCLGLTRFVNVDSIKVELEPGDRILVCSDGLTDMITDEEVKEALEKRSSVDDVAWHLIELANGAGGVDNITVIVADVTD